MSGFVSPFLVHSAVQAITPLLLAALAGSLCAQAGVFNIALEGQMLVGAFAAVAGSFHFASAAAGVACGAVAATLFALILAYGSTVLRGDAIVIGIGMNLLASGLTAYLLRQMFGVSGTFDDPRIIGLPALHIAAIAHTPFAAALFSGQTALTWLAWALTAAIGVGLFRTAPGLRLRGIGEQAAAAATLGVAVRRYQVAVVLGGGALCGLAGAQLALGTITVFSEDMSAGRGWIAVVAVMLGRNNPLLAALACVLFGFADAVGLRLQSLGMASQLTDIAPYVVTLAALLLGRRPRLA